MLCDTQAYEAYRNDPFNPHAIARHRLGAYKRAVFMRYLDNLLDWGDHLFAQDTAESINEATLLYIMATDLLGRRPAELGDCREEPEQMTYESILERIEQCAMEAVETMEGVSGRCHRAGWTETNEEESSSDVYYWYGGGRGIMEDFFGDNWNNGSDAPETTRDLRPGALGIPRREMSDAQIHADLIQHRVASFGTSFLRQVCLFCIPPNPDLLAYWDRVEDRLFKIRNCMNISGVRRELSLFAPEIDPRLLVRARAAGLSIEDVLARARTEVPPYRFTFLIGKAKEYAEAVRSFGNALLSALEKKDADELERLRLTHQQNLLQLTRRLRQDEVAAAEASLEALRRRHQVVEDRRNRLEGSLNAGPTSEERAQSDLKVVGKGFKATTAVLQYGAAALALPPKIVGMANSLTSDSLKDGLEHTAKATKALGEYYDATAEIVATHAKISKEKSQLRSQLRTADGELRELSQQILAQEIRRAMAERARDIHDQTQRQLDETLAFYRDRFTNASLYRWLATTMQRLHREAYQSAYALAQLAERAYQFERNGDQTLLRGNYWDASKAGLLAGERLLVDLLDMERRFMETNHRRLEVEQSFSLGEIDAGALGALQAEGECIFVVPERNFDRFYPGQYGRRIRSVCLSMPCDAGDNVNVGATLNLLDSYIRTAPDTAGEALEQVPATHTAIIATSNAVRDAGVFQFDFRDERYLPFEGAGAVNSAWRLRLPRLPAEMRPFDYNTIEDVILHISYEAEYDETLQADVESALTASSS
jgi:hypothetical protein